MYDPRNDYRKATAIDAYERDHKGRRRFDSLEELQEWERVCGPFGAKGSFIENVRIPGDDRFPAEWIQKRVYWGR